jgi:DNA-binding CsgD family transcriptional regulator
VIDVGATMRRGSVAVAKERYALALRLFSGALETSRHSAKRDRNLEEQLELDVAMLELALRSQQVPGTHHRRRRESEKALVDISARSRAKMQIASVDAWLYALEGDQRTAYALVRRSVAFAPTPAWRVWAVANRALIRIAFGDLAGAADFTAEALEGSASIGWAQVEPEEQVALLFLAWALTEIDPDAGPELFEHYCSLSAGAARSRPFAPDIRLWLVETFVRGLVHRIRCEVAQASHAFADVCDEAERVGLFWLATLAVLESESIDPANRPADSSASEAAERVRKHYPRSFLARRLGRRPCAIDDEIVAALTPAPREVLALLLSGMKPKEIARLKGLAEGTVPNYIGALETAFGVRSMPELLVACYRCGLSDFSERRSSRAT